MKKILGLDLGTNSIGWALVDHDIVNKDGEILGIGSRILPMSQDIFDSFGKGQSYSQTAERTRYRSVRRLYQRDDLRRERLHRVLNILGFLPSHYAASLDFVEKPGQFKDLGIHESEVKLNYRKNDSGKFEFIFIESFNEMVSEFQGVGNMSKIPLDWTIYYLRKKALIEKVTKEELAWIILNFNQKRGYYQLRGEDSESDNTKLEEFHVLTVTSVEATSDKNVNGVWYNIHLGDGLVYKRQSKESLENWVGKKMEFIITTQLEADGSVKIDKEGNIKRSFRAVDSEKDWIAIKSKTEADIEKSEKTVGQFIYETLLNRPEQKIRGRLVRTIERKYYRHELMAILKSQMQFHEELRNPLLYRKCIDELYPRNEAHQNNIINRDFSYLFIDDIIFYQRPLKSKKSTIANCQYESRTFNQLSKETQYDGSEVEKLNFRIEGVKAIPKSHPLFQEFRLWQFAKYIRVFKKGISKDEDITAQIFSDEEAWVELFEFFNSRKEIEQKHFIDFLIRKKYILKADRNNYRWNYVEEKIYPGNETRAQFCSRLSKIDNLEINSFLTPEIETHLWHLIYSVKDKTEYEKALKTFASRYKIDVQNFVELFRKFPPFPNEYGAYSHKAICKLLPLMRMGKYWNVDQIHNDTLIRINKIIDGEIDDTIRTRVREMAIDLKSVEQFRGLPVWLACYIVYDRHSESSVETKWNSPEDIDIFLNEFKQHSLNNPIVEQVVTETLRVIRDIWKYYGSGAKDYFDEIHVELGREMKNPASIRKAMSDKNAENENTNHRIRELLQELLNDSSIEGEVRPYSPSQQEILKIYEEGIYHSSEADFSLVSSDEIDKIRKNVSPTKAELNRYKLWLEQGYRSPYTGEMIPLNRLFTTDYQIEHIIPQARYFDNSLSNKVICESVINANPYKDNQTGYEFIKNNQGRVVSELSRGDKTVRIFTLQEYEDNCAKYFGKNREKIKKLLMEEIPEDFINRQLNDTRYISKFIKSLLNNIVRNEDDKGSISHKILPVTGSITTKLKRDWGLSDKWNKIIEPRFVRLNKLTNSEDFGFWDKEIGAFRCEVPINLKKGFSNKRIDHRHHALDALTIACCDRRHIHYLNALNSEKENISLRDILLVKSSQGDYTKTMRLPWNSFPSDALNALHGTVVSFKKNVRVINKTKNKTWRWVDKNGMFKKELVSQVKGDNWAIRKPLHKETVSGLVKVRDRKRVSFINGVKDYKNLVDKALKKKISVLISEGKTINDILKYYKKEPYQIDGKTISELEVYFYTKNATATRISLSEKFSRKQLENVTDSGIRKILGNHLDMYTDSDQKERFDLAFNADGIDELNRNIVQLNGGKPHQPIYKVRIFEEGSKFKVGLNGNKSRKYVEAAKGTNLFFSIYVDGDGKRNYETVPLNEVIEHQIQVASMPAMDRTTVPLNPDLGNYLFTLSPNDLVYVPDVEEIENPHILDFKTIEVNRVNRIYKMVSCSSNQCFFIRNDIAMPIVNKFEFSIKNKAERAISGEMIKDICWKLEINRIGRVTKIIR